METQISVGDIVVVKEVDTNDLKKGDIIAFRNNDIVITHRIDDVIIDETGNKKYVTKGDNNNTQDEGYVLPEQVEGVFRFKVARLGNLAMFIQTPGGMIVCLSVPILLLAIIEISDSKKNKEIISQKMNKQKEMEEETTTDIIKIKESDMEEVKDDQLNIFKNEKFNGKNMIAPHSYGEY